MTMVAAADISSQDELESMRETFGEDFSMLAELYLADSPKRIAALREAAAGGDAAQAARVAHSLGGSSASIGAPALAAQCLALEQDCRNGALDKLSQQLQNIETAYKHLETKIRGMLQA
ncbi:HPt (histidine-containing phosphotransfer) domain-containing protein [Paucimonas lemoignei]|uniref:HPt (Histidine-containing phosphotransfer) domain-containing protein n=1 Tax=Paucimonas lemoignei TaxID=29443 RepID=A0A4R3HZK5_PAULE|nr:Hpt domain-containing protein [Paucimonas lemoignei]TCS38688.1 HPt (histidine-containing phosphotransfer) domain-containing protein [Paucimonas lemoignei]